jgi:hypothetical protein
LAHRIDRISPPGPVLDVGAGDGALVAALAELGRESVGVDPYGPPTPRVLQGELDEVSGQFASVVFWHSLEHMPEPSQALLRGVDLLTPGGVLIVAAPNIGSLQARAFGNHWVALDAPRHLVHLTTEALVKRFSSLGLEVTRISHVRGGQVVFGWLHGFVRAVTGLDLYDAIRRPEARERPLTAGKQAVARAVGLACLPVALLGALVEITTRRGGSVYMEARA